MTDRPDDLFERIPDRHHRARVYWGVVGAVENAGSDRPGMAEFALCRNRTSAGHGLGDVQSAITAAVDNDDLHPIPDRDGRTRYVRGCEECLTEAVQYLADFEDPPREVIGELNRAIR